MNLPAIALRIAGGVLAVLVVVAVVTWVAGIGPFQLGKSAAAKQQPKVEKAVTQATAGAGKQTTALAEKAATANTETERRAEAHVTKIRAPARARPPTGAPVVRYADFPDGQFYGGVCESILYRGNPACSGHGGRPEGQPAAGRPGALRRR